MERRVPIRSRRLPPSWAAEALTTVQFSQRQSKTNIKHAFIEQEQYDMPPMEALKIDAEYWKALTV